MRKNQYQSYHSSQSQNCTDNPVNQSTLESNECSRLKARENVDKRVIIGENGVSFSTQLQSVESQSKYEQLFNTQAKSSRKYKSTARLITQPTHLTYLSAIPSSISGSVRFGCSPIRESLSLATSSSITFMSGYSLSTS